MKALLLQTVTWFPEPGVKKTGSVVRKQTAHSYKGKALIDQSESYVVASEKHYTVSAIDIHSVRTPTVEELLTNNIEKIRKIGKIALIHTQLFATALELSDQPGYGLEEFIQTFEGLLSNGSSARSY